MKMNKEVKPFHLAFEKKLDYLDDYKKVDGKGPTGYVASSVALNRWINLLDIEEIYDITFHVRNFSNRSSYAEICYKKYHNDHGEDFAIYFDTIEDDEQMNKRVIEDATALITEFYESFLDAWKKRGQE